MVQDLPCRSPIPYPRRRYEKKEEPESTSCELPKKGNDISQLHRTTNILNEHAAAHDFDNRSSLGPALKPVNRNPQLDKQKGPVRGTQGL